MICLWSLWKYYSTQKKEKKIVHRRNISHVRTEICCSGTCYRSQLIFKRKINKICTILVARMAVDDVNFNTSMLANYELSLDIKDGKCEPDVVMKMFIDIIRTKALSRFSSTVGVLGPACSNTVEAIAGVSKHYRTVVVTYRYLNYFCGSNTKYFPQCQGFSVHGNGGQISIFLQNSSL